MKRIIGVVITIAWAAALLKGMILGDYEAAKYVTPTMLIFVGYLYGDNIVFRKRPDQDG